MAFTSLIIEKNNKFLMQLRDNIDSIPWPNCWGTFGGSIEGEESPIEGIIREIDEELELKLNENEIKLLREMDYCDTKVYFFHYLLDKDESLLHLHEGSGMKWFSIDEIRNLKNITPSAKEFFLEYKLN